MDVRVTGKNFEVTDPIKSYVKKRINQHIDKVLLKATSVDVVLSVDKKYRHISDVTVHGINSTIHSTATSEDMYSSIDLVVEKLSRQAVRVKEKITSHAIRKERRPAKNMGAGSPQRELRKIVERNDKIALKPMSVDEAVLQLEALEYNFLVFREENNEDVSIVYKRENGSYGLIGPLK